MKEPNPDEIRRIDPDAADKKGPSPALIGFVIVVILTIVFIARNRDRTELDFLLFEVHSRVWTAIAVSIALGVVLDRLFSHFWRKRRERKRKE